MIIMAGASSRHLAVLTGVIVALIPFALIIAVSDYQEERLATFLDPEEIVSAPATTSSGRDQRWVGRAVRPGVHGGHAESARFLAGADD